MQQDHFEIPDYAPPIGGVYAHYKNREKEYKVTGISLNSDSNEWHVEYIPLYEDAAATKFNRALSSWLNKVNVDGEEQDRYRLVRVEEL